MGAFVSLFRSRCSPGRSSIRFLIPSSGCLLLVLPDTRLLTASGARLPMLPGACFLTASGARLPMLPGASFLTASGARLPMLPGASFLTASGARLQGRSSVRPPRGCVIRLAIQSRVNVLILSGSRLPEPLVEDQLLVRCAGQRPAASRRLRPVRTPVRNG
jgi:hypothetical protein